jgi:protein transport protein SEC61 subunit alpha
VQLTYHSNVDILDRKLIRQVRSSTSFTEHHTHHNESTPLSIPLSHDTSIPLITTPYTPLTVLRPTRSISIRTQAASLSLNTGRWLGDKSSQNTLDREEEDLHFPPRYGQELTVEEWDPLGLAMASTNMMAMANGDPSSKYRGESSSSTSPSSSGGGGGGGNVFGTDLPQKLALLMGLIIFSRVGVYLRLPGVDVDKFAEAISSGSGGLLGYIDSLSGGSISRVGVFSLGIIPFINASIMLQLLSTAFPGLKKLQREEGPQGRARFNLYQRLAALAFAFVQAIGQLSYIRPFVDDYSADWFVASVLSLVAGAMILVQVAETISELKLGNGTSILIFANIASALPTSVGAAFSQAATNQSSNLAIYAAAFFATTLGIVYVQDAERQIPMTYASRYRAGSLAQQAYLPFKVNATGVMPVIFASSLLALPTAAARYIDSPVVDTVAASLAPNGVAYLPTNVVLIAFFNYLYTFLQLEPQELAEQLKRQGASISGVRPGRNTAEFVTKTLKRLSVLGSAFLGALALAPSLVEATTGLTAFRGFAGTSVLIIVGVATDTARRFRAEMAMSKYGNLDNLYDDMK